MKSFSLVGIESIQVVKHVLKPSPVPIRRCLRFWSYTEVKIHESMG